MRIITMRAILLGIAIFSLLIAAVAVPFISGMHQLTSTEKQLVGTWKMSNDPLLVLSLHGTRKWILHMSLDGSTRSLQEIDCGTWRAHDIELQIFSDAEAMLPMLRDKYLTHRDGYQILGVSDVAVSVQRDGASFTWERASKVDSK